MAYIQRSDAILTLVVNDNVLVGNQFEFAPFTGKVELGLVASATGFEVDVLVGAETVVTRMLPSLANRFAVYPDDFTVVFGCLKGDRIVVRARNTSGGTLTLFTTVKFTRLM